MGELKMDSIGKERNAFRARATKTFGAIVLAILMIGIPSFLTGGDALNVVDQAGAVDRERSQFVVGLSGELTISTLNPNTYTWMAEAMVIWSLYSSLLQRDVDNEIIGDLAYEWSATPDGMTWTFNIWDNIYFCDPADPDPATPVEERHLTVDDVIWSLWMFQNNSLSRLNANMGGAIGSMEKINDFEMSITLCKPYAPFIDIFTMPILPKYIWENVDPQRFDNMPPVGSGPWYYATDGLPTTNTVELRRNPQWYMEENCGWQMHIEQLFIQGELEASTAWQNVKAGSIDVMLGVSPSVYVSEMDSTPYVLGFAQSQGFVYEFNLNQMTDELRAQLGGTVKSGTNNQLLLIDEIKLAIAMSVNKTAFIHEVLEDLGSVATSLVPDVNPWYYEYGSIEGEKQIPFDTGYARSILYEAGWKYDALGKAANNETCPLYRQLPTGGYGDPLKFRFYSLNTVTEWEEGARMIVNWTNEAGIELDLELVSGTTLTNYWYAADYDIWLWDWIFGPLNDPCTGVLTVLTTDAIGIDSDVYWSNATFDALYDQSIVTMDPVIRQEIVDEMQRMAYENMGCQCIAFRKDLYAASTRYWSNYGDWNNTYMLLPDVTFQYLGMRVQPTDNEAPQFTGFTASLTGDMGTPITGFSATVSDDDETTPLRMKWFWGDGSASSDVPVDETGTVSMTHTYAEDGIYTAYIAVYEDGPSNGFDDGFMTWTKAQVTVRDMTNGEPVIQEIIVDPTDPDTGTEITFTCVATDDEDDTLYYEWNFGDGSILGGQTVTHQFTTATSYTVSVAVDDKHIGSVDRPTMGYAYVPVTSNRAPTVTVPDYANKIAKQTYTYTATASDPDSRDELQYTWYWGDGTFSVTTTASADHAYNSRGTYTLTVWVDDQTGLDNHNISDSGLVSVITMSNKAPVIQDFTITDSTPAATYCGEDLVFVGLASDKDEDPLTITFEFGDGSYYVERFAGTGAAVECSTTHSYENAGTHTVYMHASDGAANVSTELSVVVLANDPPEFQEEPATIYGTTNEATSFSVDVIDPNSDSLKYTWSWDDGTASVTASGSTTHTYTQSSDEDGYVYRVWADDGKGYNESAAGYAFINAKPVLNSLTWINVTQDVSRTYTAVATDSDGESLIYTWNFGDGTGYFVGNSITHTYTVVGNYTRQVWVYDGFPLSSHNVTSDAKTTVRPAGTNYEPEFTTYPADKTVAVGQTTGYHADASDPDEDDLTYTWDFYDDGSILLVGQDVDYAYDTIGTHTCRVYVDDGMGHNVSASATIEVVADAPPVADAGEDITAPEDEPVMFDGRGSSDDVGVINWTWTIDELSATLYGSQPEYEFLDVGTYTVTLVVRDTIDQESVPDEITVTITDATDPTAVAEADDMDVDMGDTVTFDGSDSSDNVEVVNWTWTLVDEVIVTLYGESVSYQFDTPGTYTVTLVVKDAMGNEGSVEIDIIVRDTEAPVAVAEASESEVDMDAMVTLDGSGSSDNYDDEMDFVWTFTDGVAVELIGETIEYTFENAGVFEITLTVTDDEGNSDTATVTVTVLDTQSPVADASASATEVDAGTTVTFDGTASTDNVGIDSYTWTFTYNGAPVSLDGATVSFEFDIAGAYIVTLNVTDAAGNYDIATVTITVQASATDAAPTAVATVTPTSATVGTSVTFSSTGSSDDIGIVNYTWTFVYEDATVTRYTASFSFTFDAAGTYDVTLTVRDGSGQTDEATVSVTIETDDDEKTFIEQYGLPIGVLAALAIVALLAIMLMKKGKGGKSSGANDSDVDGIALEEPAPPEDQNL